MKLNDEKEEDPNLFDTLYRDLGDFFSFFFILCENEDTKRKRLQGCDVKKRQPQTYSSHWQVEKHEQQGSWGLKGNVSDKLSQTKAKDAPF